MYTYHVVHYTSISTYHILLLLLACTHVGSTTVVTVAQVNSTNQTADVLVEYQLQPPLDLVMVCQKQNVHKLNGKAVRGSLTLLMTPQMPSLPNSNST